MQKRVIGIVALVSLVSLGAASLTAQVAIQTSPVHVARSLLLDTAFRSLRRVQSAGIAPFAVDSVKPRSHRAAVVGGAIGAIVGGLAAAGYVLNATAYDCVTSGPPCSDDHHTTRRVATITLGAAGGAFLGAWLGHRISGTGQFAPSAR